MASFWTKHIGYLFSKKSDKPIVEEQQTEQVFQGPSLVNGGMLMITNGGPHPAEKWAEATARMIVDVADNISGERRGTAIKLQGAVKAFLLRTAGLFVVLPLFYICVLGFVIWWTLKMIAYTWSGK